MVITDYIYVITQENWDSISWHVTADIGLGYKRAIFSRFWSRTYHFLTKYRMETDMRFICENISKL